MTKSKSPARMEKISFFEEYFYSPNDDMVVVGVNNSDNKCYLQHPLSSNFKDPFFQMPFKSSVMGEFVQLTDLGIKGTIIHTTETSDSLEIKFHIPWNNIVYMAIPKDGEEKPITKKW